MQYFYGEDTFAAREAVDALAAERGATVRWLGREDLEGKRLADWVDQGSSGLFGKELCVVRDVSTMPKSMQESVAEADCDAVVWDQAAPDKRSKLFKALKPAATEFRRMEERELVQWVEQEVSKPTHLNIGVTSKHNYSIDRDAALELVRRVGSDKWQLQTMLEVLMLTRDEIKREDVEGHVPDHANGEIFAMLDALAAGNTQKAISMMEAILASGESEFYIFSMLAYQCKTLFMIRSGNTKGLHPYVVQKNSAVAGRFSESALLNALTKVVATDFAIKQGKVDSRTALIMLVTGLFA